MGHIQQCLSVGQIVQHTGVLPYTSRRVNVSLLIKSQTISSLLIQYDITTCQVINFPLYGLPTFEKFERKKIKQIDNAMQSKESKLHIFYEMVDKS